MKSIVTSNDKKYQPLRKRLSENDNFFYLLSALMFLLLSSALVDQFFDSTLVGQSLVLGQTIVTMGVGVWSLRSNKFAFKTTIGLILATIGISLAVIFFGKADLSFLLLLFFLSFFVLTIKLAAEQILLCNQTTKNTLAGAICVFLLIGLIWTMLYLLLLEFSAEAFSGIEQTNWQETFPDLIYFSFVVLTTLGFGDILPISPLARFFVYSEAVIGMFYMAMIVSSLVSSHISSNITNDP